MFAFSVACADEVKGIEFTVTTLNCTQDQNNVAPNEQRRKFSSLRKTGALSKAVRSKISKSFYSNSSSNKADKLANVQASSDSEKICDIQFSSKEKTPLCTEATTATIEKTPPITKSEKHKKRSKLCQLL